MMCKVRLCCGESLHRHFLILQNRLLLEKFSMPLVGQNRLDNLSRNLYMLNYCPVKIKQLLLLREKMYACLFEYCDFISLAVARLLMSLVKTRLAVCML